MSFGHILMYFGHIARRDGDNLEKQCVDGRVAGCASRGRPKARWTDNIRALNGGSLYGLSKTALDRDAWKDALMD